MRYRRALVKGGTYFFTVNLADRSRHLLAEHIDVLRMVVHKVQLDHPFEIIAAVVLPDHLHTVWRLPAEDSNYAIRWSLIKSGFSRYIPATEPVCNTRIHKRERGIWQRRYWEHQIRDDQDLQAHVDYIHNNPVKHGYVARPVEWPHSSVHQYIRRDQITASWGTGKVDDLLCNGERE